MINGTKKTMQTSPFSSKNIKRALGLGAAMIALSAASPAWADCTTPDSPEGGLNYVPASDIYQLCDGTNWIDILTSDTASVALSGITAAGATNTIANGAYAQVWNWDTLTTETALTLGSTSITSGALLEISSSATAMTGTMVNAELTGDDAGNTGTVVRTAVTGTSSEAVPLMVTNLGAGDSFRVNDETGDADTSPFIIDASGNVGVGIEAPESPIHVSEGEILTKGSTGNEAVRIRDNDNDILVEMANVFGHGGLRVRNSNGTTAVNLVAENPTHWKYINVGKLGIQKGSQAVVALDIGGTIKIGDGGETCSGGETDFQGAIRYNATSDAIEFCKDNDTSDDSWEALADSGSTVTSLNDLTDGRESNSSLYLGTDTAPSATGDGNLILGLGAADDLLGGRFNTAFGNNALEANVTGNSNTAIGYSAMEGNLSANADAADANVAIGRSALRYTFGDNNVAIGNDTLVNTAESDNNTVVGYQAGAQLSGDGNNSNVFLGYQAGYNQTAGSSNIVIGAGENTAVLTGSNQLNIGGLIYGALDTNLMGINVTDPKTALHVSGSVILGDGSETCSGGETDFQGAIRYNATSDAIEYCKDNDTSDDSWEALSTSGASSLWTDNTESISRENFYILNSGETSDTAGLSANGGGADGRLVIFNPDKMALHGGEIWGGNDAFDANNIGINSFAWGWNAQASGPATIALGPSTNSTNTYTVAIGDQAQATGDRAIAIGGSASAQSSISVGGIASGDYSRAIGRYALAESIGTVALGYGVRAQGDYSVAISAGNNYPSGNVAPIVSGNNSMGIFLGVNDGITMSATETLGVYGGKILIDDDGSAGSQGCIDYLQGTGLRYSDDCSSYTAFNAAGGASAINGLSDAFTDYATNHNIIIGRTGAAALTTGAQNNVFVGETAGATTANSTSGTDANTAMGYNALNSLTNGGYNVAIGYEVLSSNTNGGDNVAVGAEALVSNTVGSANVAIGRYSLYGNNGDGNIALGLSTLFSNTSGYNNIALASNALRSNAGGYENIGIGADALRANTSGYNNVAIGSYAGDTITIGANNIFIGYGVDAPTGATSGLLNIGNAFYGDMVTGEYTLAGTASLKVPVGTSGQRPTTPTDGMIRYNTTTPGFEVRESSSWVAMGSSVSDERLKQDIQTLDAHDIMERLAQVETYSYRMKADENQTLQYGVIAQQVDDIFPELVNGRDDDNKNMMSVRYNGFIAPLIEASKELYAENKALKAEIEAIKAEQGATRESLDELTKQVSLLNKMAGDSVGKASYGQYMMILIGLLLGMGLMAGAHRLRKA